MPVVQANTCVSSMKSMGKFEGHSLMKFSGWKWHWKKPNRHHLTTDKLLRKMICPSHVLALATIKKSLFRPHKPPSHYCTFYPLLFHSFCFAYLPSIQMVINGLATSSVVICVSGCVSQIAKQVWRTDSERGASAPQKPATKSSGRSEIVLNVRKAGDLLKHHGRLVQPAVIGFLMEQSVNPLALTLLSLP